MNNQETFILILVILLVFLAFSSSNENFESNPNYYPCATNPLNSNCTCPTNLKTITQGPYPIEYGLKNPIKLECVNNEFQEPPTTLFGNPPE
jgi:hypothetical protein